MAISASPPIPTMHVTQEYLPGAVSPLESTPAQVPTPVTTPTLAPATTAIVSVSSDFSATPSVSSTNLKEISDDIIPSTLQPPSLPLHQSTATTGMVTPVVTMVPPPTSNVVKVHQIAKLRSVLEVAEDFLGHGLVRPMYYNQLTNTLPSTNILPSPLINLLLSTISTLPSCLTELLFLVHLSTHITGRGRTSACHRGS